MGKHRRAAIPHKTHLDEFRFLTEEYGYSAEEAISRIADACGKRTWHVREILTEEQAKCQPS